MAVQQNNVNGQATKANSQPVVLASDQDALPITDNGGSVTVDASSLPLPSGASTSAKQDTGNASLSSIDGKITAVNTGAVVISSGSVTANAGTNLNTSALALESGGNLAGAATSLALIDDTIATDGSATPTKGVLMAGQDGTNAQTVLTDTTGRQVVVGSATGSTVPATAFYMGILDSTGALIALRTAASASDGTSGNNVLAIEPFRFNGTNQDRERGNENVTLLASGARTTTQTGSDITNYNGLTYLDVILDVTSAGTGSTTLSIQGKDPASSKYYDLLVGLAVTTNSTNVYRVGVGLTAAANSIANLPLPRTFRIVVTANNANSQTYSVGYVMMRQ